MDIINGLFQGLIQGVANTFIFMFTFLLDLVLTLFGEWTFPNFSTYSQFLINFWDLVFQFVGYIRSIFLIDAFSMNIILTILLIRLTYKPTISVVKWFISWFSHLKG